MAEAAGGGAHVDPAGEHHRGREVAQVLEPDGPEPELPTKGVEHPCDPFRLAMVSGGRPPATRRRASGPSSRSISRARPSARASWVLSAGTGRVVEGQVPRPDPSFVCRGSTPPGVSEDRPTHGRPPGPRGRRQTTGGRRARPAGTRWWRLRRRWRRGRRCPAPWPRRSVRRSRRWSEGVGSCSATGGGVAWSLGDRSSRPQRTPWRSAAQITVWTFRQATSPRVQRPSCGPGGRRCRSRSDAGGPWVRRPGRDGCRSLTGTEPASKGPDRSPRGAPSTARGAARRSPDRGRCRLASCLAASMEAARSASAFPPSGPPVFGVQRLRDVAVAAGAVLARRNPDLPDPWSALTYAARHEPATSRRGVREYWDALWVAVVSSGAEIS